MKILIILLTTFATHTASASFLDNCEFTMEVISIGPLHGPDFELPFYNQEVTAEVKAVKDLGGHVGCHPHIGETHNMKLQAVALESLAFIQPQHNILVEYFHVSSLGPNGVVSHTRYEIAGAAKKAYEGAITQPEVIKAIADLRADLANGNIAEVKLVSAVATPIPGGICGFAGCESIYLLNLTYGKTGMNQLTGTIVVKAHVQPLAMNPRIELVTTLKN